MHTAGTLLRCSLKKTIEDRFKAFWKRGKAGLTLVIDFLHPFFFQERPKVIMDCLPAAPRVLNSSQTWTFHDGSMLITSSGIGRQRKTPMGNSGQTKTQFEATRDLLIRYGLVLVIGWIGAMKFTSYEAHGIEPMVAHSPVIGWMYKFLSVQTFSNLLGIVEIAIASLIALRPQAIIYRQRFGSANVSHGP